MEEKRFSRSELDQAVAPLFTTSREERQRRALPVLREVRRRIESGARIFDALFNCTKGSTLEVAFARVELVLAGVPCVDVERVHQFGDVALSLWVVDTAIRKCGAHQRGGWRVVSGGRAA